MPGHEAAGKMSVDNAADDVGEVGVRTDAVELSGLALVVRAA